jgi:hypothetical protein
MNRVSEHRRLKFCHRMTAHPMPAMMLRRQHLTRLLHAGDRID